MFLIQNTSVSVCLHLYLTVHLLSLSASKLHLQFTVREPVALESVGRVLLGGHRHRCNTEDMMYAIVNRCQHAESSLELVAPSQLQQVGWHSFLCMKELCE